MIQEAWDLAPPGGYSIITYSNNSSSNGQGEDPPNTPQATTSVEDIIKAFYDFFGLELDPEDPKNRDKIDQGKKNVTNATQSINDLNKVIIVNGTIIIVTAGVGYAVEAGGGALMLRVMSSIELKAAEKSYKAFSSVVESGAYKFLEFKSYQLLNWLNATKGGDVVKTLIASNMPHDATLSFPINEQTELLFKTFELILKENPSGSSKKTDEEFMKSFDWSKYGKYTK
jgi:hypothetical protein